MLLPLTRPAAARLLSGVRRALAVALFAAAAGWLLARRAAVEPQAAPPAVPIAPQPAIAVSSPPDAGSEARAPRVPAARPLPPTSDRFCLSDGASESYVVHFTPGRFVAEQANRRLRALSEASSLRVRWASAAMRAGRGAIGLNPAQRAIALLALEPASYSDSAARDLRASADTDPALWMKLFQVEIARGREAEADDAARRAYRLAPDEPAPAFVFAQRARFDVSPEPAIAALDTYLTRGEKLPAVSRAKALLEVQRDIQAGWPSLEQHGVSVAWSREVMDESRARQLARSVEAALDDAARTTGTPRRPRLSVFVYPGHEELLAVTCVRSWSEAVYDGALRLVGRAGAESPDARTVRHETLHAQLRAAGPALPTWFHEGLATVFAGETGRPVRARWSDMVRNRTWIPFASLDDSFQAFDGRDDAGLAYAQSAAMVRWMVDAGGDGAVARAVAMFGRGMNAEQVLAAVLGRGRVDGGALVEWLAARNP